MNNQIGDSPVGIISDPMEVPAHNFEAAAQQAIPRDVTRYVVMAGDLLPASTKRNFKDLPAVHLGGMHFSEQDVPGLWKFKGFLTRGRITPLIKNSVLAHATDPITRKTEGSQAQPQKYRMAYPWDSLLTLRSPHIDRKGPVEVEALIGVEWDTNIVQELQGVIFPDWDLIRDGKKEMPLTVSEFCRYIESRKNATADTIVHAVADAFLISADKFRIYAGQVLDQAQDAVKRGMNDLGYSAVYKEYHRLLAAQIERNLENAPTVIVQGGTSPVSTASMSEVELDLKRREIAAMEERNRLAAMSLEGRSSAKTEPVKAEAVTEVESSPKAGADEAPEPKKASKK